uniref:ABC-type glutathione transport system ATPase component, contains duplicated ATPase domain n=1 Tax=Candidatus Kentrum sp. SD TaxID=2126332 RepID=A0A451BRH3_9GAMM|nr:MAG: ABC-type glutathione transport system ATPase component, contains duplicated ATPase domain [Candidatus Kentron sp. SD]
MTHIYKARLLFVIFSTSAFVFINTVHLSLLVFIFSLLVLYAYRPVAYYKLLLVILFINTIYMLIGNVLFSPIQGVTYHFMIFDINQAGLEKGIIGALKRNAMILVSFAWLSSIRSLEDVYYSLCLNNFQTYNKYLLIFLRHVLNQELRLQHQFYGLKIRGIANKASSYRMKMTQAGLLMKSLFYRFFSDIGPLTYAGESHFTAHSSCDAMNPHINIIGLTVRYDELEIPALRDLDFSADGKSFIFLSGANKSGKTSLMRVISGYIPNVIGEILGKVSICGTLFTNNLEINDLAVNVKYIFGDSDSFLIGLTVRQEILLHTSDEQHAIQSLKIMKVDHLTGRLTSSLSGGEKARLVLASLLVSKAKIVLLDSVLSQLDARGREDFIDALKIFYERNDCIVIVSDHFPWYFKSIATRCIQLDCGVLSKDTDDPNVIVSLLKEDQEKLHFDQEITDERKRLIELKHVGIEFNDYEAIKDFSLVVHQSELIVITGRNGAGKTTAMYALSGLLKIARGERIIHSQNFSVGYLFQNANLQIVGANVEEELLVGPILKKWSKTRTVSYLRDKYSELNINPKESTLSLYPTDLSFLAIAAADVGVDLLIFDEPSIYMDPADLRRFCQIVNDFRRRGIAILIVSHDKRIIASAEKVISMDRKR